MKTSYSLRLCGIDLRNLDEYDRLGPELEGIYFEAVGELSLAEVVVDSPHGAARAVAAAQLIERHAPGVSVAGPFRQRVTVSEIAERLEVGREAVRLWTLGRRRSKRTFPAAQEVNTAGEKFTYRYSWAEVALWARGEGLWSPVEDVLPASESELSEFEVQLQLSRQRAQKSPPGVSLIVRHFSDDSRAIRVLGTTVAPLPTTRSGPVKVFLHDEQVAKVRA